MKIAEFYVHTAQSVKIPDLTEEDFLKHQHSIFFFLEKTHNLNVEDFEECGVTGNILNLYFYTGVEKKVHELVLHDSEPDFHIGEFIVIPQSLAQALNSEDIGDNQVFAPYDEIQIESVSRAYSEPPKYSRSIYLLKTFVVNIQPIVITADSTKFLFGDSQNEL